jgi:hypothetical protein
VDLAGDFELVRRRLGHPSQVTVDGERDHRRAMGGHVRQYLVDPLPPVLQVDRVDDRAARRLIERDRDDVALGRVDAERSLDGLGQQLDHGPHLVRFVLPFGQGDAHVEQVGATFYLLPGDLENAVVVVLEEVPLHLA